MTALALLILGSGILMIFGAYRNVSPIKLVTDTLSP